VQGYVSLANFFTAQRANKVSHNFLFLNGAMSPPLSHVFVFLFILLGEGKVFWRWLEKENSLIRSRIIRNLQGAEFAFHPFLLYHVLENFVYVVSIWEVLSEKSTICSLLFVYFMLFFFVLKADALERFEFGVIVWRRVFGLKIFR
jgi:hypothetical protein